MRAYYDSDADAALMKGKKIAIVGFGSQGRAHALNLRDSGACELRVALRPDSISAAKAKAVGLDIASIEDAARWADVVMLLIPDESQAELYKTALAPHMKRGASLAFAHGFNIHFGFIKPRADLDVWMIAPKEVGPVVRLEYEKGGGVPCLVAVHQNATGQAMQLALSYGANLGCGRAGMYETTFREECEVDLFGEQAVLFGGLPPLMRAAFETLVEAGYEPDMAYFKCVQQVKLVADAIAKHGISVMHRIVSNTAEYGGYVAAPKLVTAETKSQMKKLLADIQSGQFAKAWIQENKEGMPFFNAERRRADAHSMESAGKQLRGERPAEK